MASIHVLVIPYPAQGHVIPMIELSQSLVKHGCQITFVNTEYDHKRVVNALTDKDPLGERIRLVSIPDGMEAWEDRNDLGKLCEAMFRVMPKKLEELIERINGLEGNKISCVIADESNGWALQVAEKMNIRRVAFWPASAALLALEFNIQTLIDDGVINHDGTPMERREVQLAPLMPSCKTENLVWACIGDLHTQKIIFNVVRRNNEAVKVADWLICNSSYGLEPIAFTIAPEIVPIGPLLASNRLANSAGNFWPEDLTCLKWLDQQQPNSVIYVAFGSFTVFDQTQFQELALGLEISNRPFLWVVRPDITEKAKESYPNELEERLGCRGKLVGWAPQQKVLSHPSIACFISHCGWNSTIEGISHGVPFLCWPYFADQFLNESYICDIWTTGLRLQKDETGIIRQTEIKEKIEKVIGDEEFKSRSMKLKKAAMDGIEEGADSHKNFANFINWLKEC